MRKILNFIVILGLVGGSLAFASGTNTFVKSTGNNISTSDFSWTPSITGKADIQSVTIHYSAETDEDIGIYLDSELGATYDTVLATSDSVAITDFFWQPDSKLLLEKDDNLNIRIESGSGDEDFTVTIRGEYQ